MKYIECPALTQLSRTLSHTSAECTVHTRIEAYSCKPIARDRKLHKAIDQSYTEETAATIAAVSPPCTDADALMVSPFGPLNKPESRRTLYLLIATLNVAFPDHDFSEVRPDHFSKEKSGAAVLNSLSETLVNLRDQPSSYGELSARSYSSFPPKSSDFFPSTHPTSSSPVNSFRPHSPEQSTHPTLSRILHEVIDLSECEVFSYSPDMDSDPHANDSDSDSLSDSSSSSEDYDFDFEPDDGFASSSFSSSGRDSPYKPLNAPWGSWGSESDGRKQSLEIGGSPTEPIPMHRRKGGLLWSSHWFFFSKKQKKMLFVSVWAKSHAGMWTGGEDRFVGWEGAWGAGSRAFEQSGPALAT